MKGTREAEGLLQDVHEFLMSSATNVEWMSEALRSALNVSTGLEGVVRTAIAQGKSVAIAGTAGSGKTHLLQSVGGNGGYKVVGDLAALPDREWKTLFKSGGKLIVAGNEGAFLQGQRKGYPGFSNVIEALHAIQRGQEYQDDGPIVIDAAGYDPAGSHSIGNMLGVPILSSYVSEKKTAASLAAWEMFKDATVRQRVAVLVETASAESDADGFTFRQLWQLISDLIVGAEADEPWFCRLFSGACEISRRLSQTFDTQSVPLPHVGNRLWHVDFNFLKPVFLDSAIPVLERLLARKARDEDERIRQFADLRLLSIFGLRDSPIDTMLRSGSDLWGEVRGGKCASLLNAINRYFAFNLLEFGDDVELWLQHDTERRMFKPNIQISLGTALSSEFDLIYSKVIANRPAEIEEVHGGRRILRHKRSGATLSVTKDLVDGILRTRSHRVHDRRDVEYDWRISQFFEQIAKDTSRPDRLRIAKFDFQARTGRLIAWQVGGVIKKVTV